MTTISDRIERYKQKRLREGRWSDLSSATQAYDNEVNAVKAIASTQGYAYMVKWWRTEKESIENLIILCDKEDLPILRQELGRAKRYLDFLEKFQHNTVVQPTPPVEKSVQEEIED